MSKKNNTVRAFAACRVCGKPVNDANQKSDLHDSCATETRSTRKGRAGREAAVAKLEEIKATAAADGAVALTGAEAIALGRVKATIAAEESSGQLALVEDIGRATGVLADGDTLNVDDNGNASVVLGDGRTVTAEPEKIADAVAAARGEQMLDGLVESAARLRVTGAAEAAEENRRLRSVANVMTAEEIEAKANAPAAPKAPKATTAHAFALLGAYGGAKAIGGDGLAAMRATLATFPAAIRAKACKLAMTKEAPKSAVVEALKVLHDEQPAIESAPATRATVFDVPKRRKVVAIRGGAAHGLWIGATEQARLAGVVEVTIRRDGSILIVPCAAGTVADDSSEGEAVVDAAVVGGEV